MTAYHASFSLPLLIVALLDVVMLAILVTHTVWRQRLIQLIIVAICTLCFAMLFVLAAYKLLNSYYMRDWLVLLTISLCLTAAGSATTLVYLILAIKRPQTPMRPLSALAAHAGPPPLLSPGPLPPVPGHAGSITAPHLGPPPIPADRLAATGRMPLGIGIAIAAIFAVSILAKLTLFTSAYFHISLAFLLALVVDLVMIAFGIGHSKWPYRKVEFSVVIVAVLILAFFTLRSLAVVLMKFSYMSRYWPASFYFFQLLSVVKLGAAGTGLFFSAKSAFGSRGAATSPIAYRPAVPPA